MIRKNNKIKIQSPVTLSFCGMCILSFLLGTPDIFILGSNNMLSILFWIFGHISIDHLLNNLLLILLLGPVVENRYNKSVFILMILITATFTAISHMLLFSHNLMGASGIVFMLIVLSSAGTKDREIPVTFILVIILFVGKEFLNSFSSSNISHFAHIIGGLLGGLFGVYLPKKQTDGY